MVLSLLTHHLTWERGESREPMQWILGLSPHGSVPWKRRRNKVLHTAMSEECGSSANRYSTLPFFFFFTSADKKKPKRLSSQSSRDYLLALKIQHLQPVLGTLLDMLINKQNIIKQTDLQSWFIQMFNLIIVQKNNKCMLKKKKHPFLSILLFNTKIIRSWND